MWSSAWLCFAIFTARESALNACSDPSLASRIFLNIERLCLAGLAGSRRSRREAGILGRLQLLLGQQMVRQEEGIGNQRGDHRGGNDPRHDHRVLGLSDDAVRQSE